MAHTEATALVEVTDLAVAAERVRSWVGTARGVPAWGIPGHPPVGQPPTPVEPLPARTLLAVLEELQLTDDPPDPANLTLLGGLAAMAGGRLTAREWVQALVRRAERLEPLVQAWVTFLPDVALAAAARADAARAQGKGGMLLGVPVGVKDMFLTRGIRTAGGSRFLAEFVPDTTADVVARLEDQGAILLGKTTTMELAFGDAPPTRNPWHPEHTPGGSSSGSAAAVAIRMAPLALGTQALGSILRPAAYCGVVGFKPTYGLIPTRGILPTGWTTDHVGFLAQTVVDAALAFGALTGAREPRLPVPRAAGLRIGVPDRYFFSDGEPAVAEAALAALKVYEGLGARLVPLRLPDSFEAAQAAAILVVYTEWAACYGAAAEQNPGAFGPLSQRRIAAGLTVRAESYLKALQVRAQFGAEMIAAMAGVNLVATPAASMPAPKTLVHTGNPAFNAAFTLVGLPALAVPVGFTAEGLPLGLQLVGRPYAEPLLLQAGHAYQAVTDWHRRVPSLVREQAAPG